MVQWHTERPIVVQ